ncbi:RICIN domain-containing protein [Streptomyces sp. NBC_01142]|uniref:RICIN domain-containing protein n=1 Tax=Streptomyces sp. NBC_01142 TaxID=2975865 RepID=UPI00224D2BC8|nr:RICIN domain-containing protein [Streptomyces sp. NBC_01142]MCX4821575.1 RICIN domain-containing protein [Streptomyces sp. NBC_01142]
MLLVGLGLPKPGSANAQGSGISIYNQGSGLAADVVAGGLANGQAVVLWPQNSSARNQQFDFVDAGGGRGYKIVARHSGKCLDVSGWSKTDGAQVFQWDCHGGTNQLWEFVDIGSPKSCPPGSGGCPEDAVGYLIVSKHSGKCLDAGNADFPSPPRQGAGLQQWTCARDTDDPWWVNQAWRTGDEPVILPPMPSEAKQMVDQIVQARRSTCGDPSVRLDPRLSEVARKHSEDLAANYSKLIDAYPRNDPRRGHIGSDNTMPADRVRAAGFTPAQRPEHWSYGTNQTYAQAMDNWLNHDEASNWGHRHAILDCNYKVLGVGKVNGHNSRVYWTQNFARG